MRPNNILVVEDELIIGKDLADGLKRKGYKNVKLVASGKEAMDFVSNTDSTDIIIMDISLDSSDHYGIDTARKIIKNYDIPVVFLTGHTDMKTRQSAEKISSYGFLTKPIDPQELVFTVENAYTLHQKQRKIKINEEKYRAMADGSTLSIFIIQNNQIAYANESFQELTGFSEREIYGSDRFIPGKLLHEQDSNRKLLSSELLSVNNSDQLSISTPLKKKTGQVIWVELYSKSIQYNNQKARLVTLIDITERREAESQTHHQYLEMNEQKNFLGEIVNSTSQNLQSPLINIFGFSAEIERDISQAKKLLGPSIDRDPVRQIFNQNIPESLDFIVKSASKMQKTISSLKQILSLREAALKRVLIDSKKLINDLIVSRKRDLKRQNIHVKIAPDLPIIKADKELMEIVFSNIIDNSIKFYDQEKNSWLSLSSASEGEFVTYFVRDNGIGIPKRHISEVFGVYNRCHTAEYEGEGVGLTLVKEIIGLHGGNCSIESEEGEGTTVRIRLPR